jgi:hypothetical protein
MARYLRPLKNLEELMLVHNGNPGTWGHEKVVDFLGVHDGADKEIVGICAANVDWFMKDVDTAFDQIKRACPGWRAPKIRIGHLLYTETSYPSDCPAQMRF